MLPQGASDGVRAVSDSILLDLFGSPAAYPVGYDDASARFAFVELNEADYRAASFLDDRVLVDRTPFEAPAGEMASAVREAPVRLHFIFHVGHVGSTLVSRLVGEHPDLFSLREPEALRALARNGAGFDADDRVAPTWLRLWSRTWREHQTTVVKATSFVSEIGVQLMRAAPDARAVLMFASPLAYLRGVFGGPASREELRATAQDRRTRLERWLGVGSSFAPMRSEGETLAMTWLAEMAAMDAIDRSQPGQARWIDFDRLLVSPRAGLTAAVEALGASAQPAWLDAVLAGPLLRRYSKGPEHAYDAGLREAVAMQADREHGMEIARGMAWLGEAARLDARILCLLEDAARRRATPFIKSLPQTAAFA